MARRYRPRASLGNRDLYLRPAVAADPRANIDAAQKRRRRSGPGGDHSLSVFERPGRLLGGRRYPRFFHGDARGALRHRRHHQHGQPVRSDHDAWHHRRRRHRGGRERAGRISVGHRAAYRGGKRRATHAFPRARFVAHHRGGVHTADVGERHHRQHSLRYSHHRHLRHRCLPGGKFPGPARASAP